jgi:hypothetical protein
MNPHHAKVTDKLLTGRYTVARTDDGDSATHGVLG